MSIGERVVTLSMLDARLRKLRQGVTGAGVTPVVDTTSQEPGNHADTHMSGGTDPIKLDELAAPDDNTTLDVSTSLHGLVPKAPNDKTKYLRGDATYHIPGCHVRETFDGLTTGDIDGQGSYMECGAWARTAAAGGSCNVAVKSGADKMLSLVSPVGAGTSSAQLAVTAPVGLMFGTLTRWKMRTNQNTANFSGGLLIGDATPNTKASVRFAYDSGLKLRFYNGATNYNFAAAAKDTWYQIDMVINYSAGAAVLIFLDGAYIGTYGAGTNDLWPTVRLYCTNAAAAGDLTLNFDDLEIFNIYPTGL